MSKSLLFIFTFLIIGSVLVSGSFFMTNNVSEIPASNDSTTQTSNIDNHGSVSSTVSYYIVDENGTYHKITETTESLYKSGYEVSDIAQIFSVSVNAVNIYSGTNIAFLSYWIKIDNVKVVVDSSKLGEYQQAAEDGIDSSNNAHLGYYLDDSIGMSSQYFNVTKTHSLEYSNDNAITFSLASIIDVPEVSDVNSVLERKLIYILENAYVVDLSTGSLTNTVINIIDTDVTSAIITFDISYSVRFSAKDLYNSPITTTVNNTIELGLTWSRDSPDVSVGGGVSDGSSTIASVWIVDDLYNYAISLRSVGIVTLVSGILFLYFERKRIRRYLR